MLTHSDVSVKSKMLTNFCQTDTSNLDFVWSDCSIRVFAFVNSEIIAAFSVCKVVVMQHCILCIIVHDSICIYSMCAKVSIFVTAYTHAFMLRIFLPSKLKFCFFVIFAKVMLMM